MKKVLSLISSKMYDQVNCEGCMLCKKYDQPCKLQTNKILHSCYPYQIGSHRDRVLVVIL